MQTPLWLWIDFNACILIVLAIDLFGFQRKAHVPSAKEAATWTLVWILLSLGLNALIWRWDGHAKALQLGTGYLKLRLPLVIQPKKQAVLQLWTRTEAPFTFVLG
jgi:hypothetical protein